MLRGCPGSGPSVHLRQPHPGLCCGAALTVAGFGLQLLLSIQRWWLCFLFLRQLALYGQKGKAVMWGAEGWSREVLRDGTRAAVPYLSRRGPRPPLSHPTVGRTPLGLRALQVEDRLDQRAGPSSRANLSFNPWLHIWMPWVSYWIMQALPLAQPHPTRAPYAFTCQMRTDPPLDFLSGTIPFSDINLWRTLVSNEGLTSLTTRSGPQTLPTNLPLSTQPAIQEHQQGLRARGRRP